MNDQICAANVTQHNQNDNFDLNHKDNCLANQRVLTCHVVPNSNSGQSDDNKVDGLQGRPSFDVFKNDGWDGDEEDAASEDEEQGGRHANLGLTDLVVFTL